MYVEDFVHMQMAKIPQVPLWEQHSLASPKVHQSVAQGQQGRWIM